MIGRCEVLSAVVVEVAGFWTVFSWTVLPWRSTFGLEKSDLTAGRSCLACWDSLYEVWILDCFEVCSSWYCSCLVVGLSWTEEAGCFFCLTCSISERRFAMVFRLCSCCSLRPLALSALVWEILLVKSRTFSFTLDFPWYTAYLALVGKSLTCSFKPLAVSTILSLVSATVPMVWPIRFPSVDFSFPSGREWSACVLAELPEPDCPFLPVTMADPAPRVVMERPSFRCRRCMWACISIRGFLITRLPTLWESLLCRENILIKSPSFM